MAGSSRPPPPPPPPHPVSCAPLCAVLLSRPSPPISLHHFSPLLSPLLSTLLRVSLPLWSRFIQRTRDATKHPRFLSRCASRTPPHGLHRPGLGVSGGAWPSWACCMSEYQFVTHCSCHTCWALTGAALLDRQLWRYITGGAGGICGDHSKTQDEVQALVHFMLGTCSRITCSCSARRLGCSQTRLLGLGCSD